MAKLQPYTANLVEPGSGFVQATPGNMGANIGAGLEKVGRGAHLLYDQIGEDESRQAIVGSAQVKAKYAKALDDATLSGADTEPLKEKMNEELAAIGENFSTKKGQDSLALHTATTNLIFDDQANRVAVSRASDKARIAAQQFLQNESATLRSNPAGLPISERNAEAFVNTFKLPPDKRALVLQDITTQLNMAAVMASVRIDPMEAKRALEGGEWKLTPQEREQGIAAADTQLRALRSDEIHQRTMQDWQVRQADAESSDKLLQKILGGTIKSGEIANDPFLRRESRENLIRFQAWYAGEHANKKHPSAMLELWLDINADSDDPRKIYTNTKIFNYAFAGRISAVEAEQASAWVGTLKDENNKAIGSKLTMAMHEVGRAVAADITINWSPQSVAAIQMDYQARVLEKVADLRKEGTSPNEVFDPKSKNFVGSREFIAQSINRVKTEMRNEGVNNSLKAGDVVARDGKNWTFLGGDPKLPGNWQDTGAAGRGAGGGF